MDKKYFVLDFKKIKSESQFNNWILGHNQRRYNLKRSNVNTKKTKDNILITECKYKSYKDFINSKKEEIKELNKQNKAKREEYVKSLSESGMDKKEAQKIARKKYPKRRGPSANQSIGFAMVIDCSEMQGWKEQDYIKYLKEAEAFLKKRFKELEVLSSVIHADESKPHLHISFAYWNREEKRFVEKKLVKEKKTNLDVLLDDFERDIGQKYGLHRGDGVTLRKALTEPLNKQKKAVEIITDKKLFGLVKKTKKVNVLSPKVVDKIINKKTKEVKAIGHAEKIKELLKENTELKEENKELKSKNLMLSKEIKNNTELQNKVKELKEQLEQKNEIIEKLINKLVETKISISKFKEKGKQIIKNKIKKEFKIR